MLDADPTNGFVYSQDGRVHRHRVWNFSGADRHRWFE